MTTSDQSQPFPNALEAYGLPLLSPLYAEPPFEYHDCKSQLMVFKSDPEVLAPLLPAPLVPDPDGLMTLTLSRFFVAGFGFYREAVLCANAMLDGEPVNHTVYVILDNDIAVGGGREIWGFPKKVGRLAFSENGGSVLNVGVERGGIEIITAAFEFGPALPLNALDSGSLAYTNLKLIPSVKKGAPPEVQQLTKVTLTNLVMKRIYQGRATLKFNESPVDHLFKLPIREIVGAFYYEADFTLDSGEIVRDYLK